MTSLSPERTELEWTYQPSDFFEAPYGYAEAEYDVLIERGRVVVNLRVPQDPVHPQLEERIQTYVTNAFRIRQLEVPRGYDLKGPSVSQHAAGRRNVQIRMTPDALLVAVGRLDTVVRDAAGNIIQDTRAERIAKHAEILDSVAPKAAQSPLLRSLLESHARSVSDAANAFVHLYEIRDALSQHYGTEGEARQKLGISERDWQRLGSLANVQPLEQGRHRGKHPVGRRVATEGELQEAREIVKRWIYDFAARLKTKSCD